MAAWQLCSLTVGPLQTNSYLLISAESGEALLADPAFEADRLIELIEGRGCRLRYLLCTHGHFDHVSAAAELQQRWDLPLLCHPLDAPLIARMPEIQAAYGFPPTTAPRLSPTLADGQILALGDGEIVVSHVPGHSPGHVMCRWQGEALVGDVIFAGSIGRTDLPGSSYRDLERSILNRIYTLPLETKLHPGHGPATTVARERESNPFIRPNPD